MEKKYRYLFQHTVIQRSKGKIQDHFKNRYEIVAENAAIAHTQVPYNSILEVVKSMEGDILHDFRAVMPSTSKRLREKVKNGGRGSLTPMEYQDAVRFEVIK